MGSGDITVVKVITQKGLGDCGIAALATFLGRNYEDVLVEATSSTQDHKAHKNGLWLTQIVEVAKVLGVTLHKRKKYDLETAQGIISLHKKVGADHVAVVINGILIDPAEGTVWFDPEDYLQAEGYTATVLLTRS